MPDFLNDPYFILPLLALVPAFYLYWTLRSRSVKLAAKSIPNCPPETLDPIPQNGDEYALNVPLDLGDVRVSNLLVHPLKSCRGTSVSEVNYTPEGLENDRKWCIVRADNHEVITAREFPPMVLIHPLIMADPSHPLGGKLLITFPEGSDCQNFEIPLNPSQDILDTWEIIDDCTMFKITFVDGYIVKPLSPGLPDPNLVLSKYFGQLVHLIMKGPKRRACDPTLSFPDLNTSAVYQDGFPLLVASEESLEHVRKVINNYARQGVIGSMDSSWETGQIEMERFRPNIVIRGAGVPFAEDVIRELVISPNRDSPSTSTPGINLVSKCARCLLPNVDVKTGVRDAAVPYKVLMKFRRGKDPARMSKPCFGVNGAPLGSGIIRVGDFVHVKEWAGPGGV